MAILNITPDSFSDGGKYLSADNAARQAEKLFSEGADMIDIGGESTRPNSQRVSVAEETRRVVPAIEAIVKRFDAPVSIDTSKSQVAKRALEAGAEIINDVSGLRFDEKIADVAAQTNAALILMNSRGTFQTMHQQLPVENILTEISESFRRSIAKAESYDVRSEQIALDVGVGFSKTPEQNLELIAKLDKIIEQYPAYPMLIGASRKSFIGKILGGAAPLERLNGSLAIAAIAAWNGVSIIRVHDVRETVEALKIVEAIKKEL